MKHAAILLVLLLASCNLFWPTPVADGQGMVKFDSRDMATIVREQQKAYESQPAWIMTVDVDLLADQPLILHGSHGCAVRGGSATLEFLDVTFVR